MATFKLKPCNILVIDVMRRGGEAISRRNYTVDIDEATGRERTVWESVRVVNDPDELKRAKVLRNKLHGQLHKIGAPGPGHIRIVALDNKDQAEQICNEAKVDAQEFNREAKFSRVEVFTDFFEISGASNIDTLRGTIQKLDDTMAALEEAMKNRDPQDMREALKEAKAFVGILPDETAKMLQEAVEETRAQASTISRADRKAQRLAQKIAEELDRPVDGLDLDVELERLRAAADTKAARLRVRKIQKMIEDREDALVMMEEAKQKIDTTPVQLMRYALKGPETQETEDRSSDMVAGFMASRQVGAV